jgi:hypothetical protein
MVMGVVVVSALTPLLAVTTAVYTGRWLDRGPPVTVAVSVTFSLNAV